MMLRLMISDKGDKIPHNEAGTVFKTSGTRTTGQSYAMGCN